jgi:hypothetical protein
MKRVFAFVLLFSAYSMAINPFIYKWTIRLTGDTATVVKWKANNDSVLNWATRISDTVTNKTPRWLELLRGDSTFHRIKADTISSNPIIDSIQGMDNISGNPKIDSMQEVDRISGNPIIDSMQGVDCIRGNTDVDSISGHPRVDSIKFGNSASYLAEYIDTTCYDSLYDGGTYRARALVRIIKIGRIVTLYQPSLTGIITAATYTLIIGIPSKFLPSVTMANAIKNPCCIRTDATMALGRIHIYSSILITTGDELYLPAATVGGVDKMVTSWILN